MFGGVNVCKYPLNYDEIKYPFYLWYDDYISRNLSRLFASLQSYLRKTLFLLPSSIQLPFDRFQWKSTIWFIKMLFICDKYFIFLYTSFWKIKELPSKWKVLPPFFNSFSYTDQKNFSFLIIRFSVVRIEVYFSIIIIVLSSVINL